MLLLGLTVEACAFERQDPDNKSSATLNSPKGTDESSTSDGAAGSKADEEEDPTGTNSETETANECAGTGKVITDANYNIMNVSQQKMLFYLSIGAAPGAGVISAPADESKDGLWRFVVDSPNTYRILHVQTGMVLAGSDPVSVGPDNGNADHKWKVSEPSDDCLITIISDADTSKRLSLTGDPAVAPLVGPVGDVGRLRLKRQGDGFPKPQAVTVEGPVLNPSMTRNAEGKLLLSHEAGKGNIFFQTGTDRLHFSDPQPALMDPPATEMRFEPSIAAQEKSFWLAYVSTSTTEKTGPPAVNLARSDTGLPRSFVLQARLSLDEFAEKINGPINPFLHVSGKDKLTITFSLPANPSTVSMASFILSTRKRETLGLTSPSANPVAGLSILAKGSTAAAGSLYLNNGRYFGFIENYTRYGWPSYSGIIKVLFLSDPSNNKWVDRAGVGSLDAGGSVFLASHGAVLGPRHASVFEDQGETFFVCQYFDQSSQPRAGINKLALVSGWPQLVD